MEVIWEVDAEGIFQYCSPALERILGYTPDEVVGKMHFYDFLTPDVKDSIKNRAFAQFSLKQPFRHVICQNIHKNGNIVMLEISGAPILDEQENLLGCCGAVMDVTERLRADEEKHHREKLQSILEMAGAVCHEMNQPMQVVYGLSEILLMNTPEKEPIHGKLVSIMNQLRRMNEITGKLMALQYYKTEDYAGFTRIVDIHESQGNTLS
jgi:PAS domain S-box-containing protein